jgi:hypothetical protein
MFRYNHRHCSTFVCSKVHVFGTFLYSDEFIASLCVWNVKVICTDYIVNTSQPKHYLSFQKDNQLWLAERVYCSAILTEKHNHTDLTYWSFIQRYYMFRQSTSAIIRQYQFTKGRRSNAE